MVDRPHKWTEAEAEAMMRLMVAAGNRIACDEPVLVMPKIALNASLAPQAGQPPDESNSRRRSILPPDSIAAVPIWTLTAREDGEQWMP